MRPAILRFPLLAVLALISLSALAQPHKFGCDHFRNLGPKRGPITDFERKLLNESIARSDTFDIAHYAINLDVTDYIGRHIIGATTITYSAKLPDLQYIIFDLKDLVVDSVNGTNITTFSQSGERLQINFLSSPVVGENMDVTVYYQGIPYRDPVWGGFYHESNYIYNLGIGLSTIPPNFGRVWYPCFDSFVERATYEYHIKSAGTYRAWCQGEFTGEIQLDGDTVIRSFDFNQPIPTHLSAIAVADYENYEFVHEGVYGEVPVSLRAKPAQMAAMQNVFVNLGEAIDACEYWFGPHGWSRVGYVLTTDGALEIPTNIAYPQFMTTQSITNNNFLLCHELGHHWWGDMVTPHVHNDMWMKEGPAEYSSHLMVEWMSGTEAFVDVVKDNQLFVLQNAHIEDEGFHPMSPMPDEHIYGRHTYYKGASVLHNLRGYMGDELFRLGMSGVQVSQAYKDLTPDELKQALEDETGIDLDPFFNDQIYKPGFATFVVDSFASSFNGTQWQTTVYIQQKLRECPTMHSNVPLDLTVLDQSLNQQDFQIVASGENTTITIDSDVEPYLIILNGYNRLNQNRMDVEGVIDPETALNPNLPYVDFKLYDEVITGETFYRVEHVWAAPDNENLGEGVYEISSSHYWNIDGVWPEGTLFEGRVNYRGNDSDDLDFDLYGTTEAEAVLVYRENSSMPWQVYSDFTITAGNLFNGTGSIRIDVLRKGQYAFANGDISLSAQSAELQEASLNLYPVPSDQFLTIEGRTAGKGTLLIDVHDIHGKLAMRSSLSANETFTRTLDISDLSQGNYIVNIRSGSGAILAKKQFVISR